MLYASYLLFVVIIEWKYESREVVIYWVFGVVAGIVMVIDFGI